MNASQNIEGQCLCGAVTARAVMSKPMMRACHCDMCQQHTSSMFMSLGIDQGSLTLDGPVKTYRSSEWAERGFCGTCGSTLFYGTVEDGNRHPSAGLFQTLEDTPLKLEFFADDALCGIALVGEHRKMTAQETIALFAPKEGEDQ
ncbi:GFA family protein [Planktotalea sp.]|uniref:GFA family protein n=1 Tax=Planktotalea sp. TaxID=2029877 RepID=UPI003296D809